MFLGAGFSALAGLPLASELMTPVEFAHSRKAARTQEAVLGAWDEWRIAHPGLAAEEFITEVYESDGVSAAALWPLLLRFIAYRLANPLTRFYPHEGRVSHSSDTVQVASVCSAHEVWWREFLHLAARGDAVTVVTTNWDILAERALRPEPQQRPPRPGFHYGWGPERLRASSGFPMSVWRRDPWIRGSIPILKLHGSLNWALEGDSTVKYGDCRPAFRGDAAIVPPVRNKLCPSWAERIWELAREAIRRAELLIIVGYSIPEYDRSTRSLLQECLAASAPRVHVFDPSWVVVQQRLLTMVPGLRVHGHPGLPEGTSELPMAFT